MDDVIVSVRMPASLAKELRRLAQDNHFLDVSEELRSIIREKSQQYLDPYGTELRRFRIEMQRQRLKPDKGREDLARDLQRIAEELKHEH